MSFGQRNYERTRPEVDFPGETPPEDLVVEELIAGGGPAAEPGDKVSCHYVGVSWSTGEEFDASWNRGQPLDFTVGTGQVIQGWDQGLIGMQQGGRRRLEIPAHLAYGDQGAGGVIAPAETLIFVVDLVDLQKA